jgi:phosphatidylglycerophosphatase C
MRIQRPGEITERIDRARTAEPNGAIAFDGDGTLWSGDVGEDIFHAMIARNRFEPPAHEKLRKTAQEHGIAEAGSACRLARTLYDEYLEQRFPEERICELMAWGCAGWTRDEVAAFARETVEAGGLPTRMHAEVLGVLAWARQAGIEVFIVSASPRGIVEEAARLVGVLPDHVVAATPLYEGAVMRAAVEQPIPYGAGKVTRLRERIGTRPVYAAFGDNVFDVPMLREARIAVAVRPKPRLMAREGEVEGMVEIAR